MRLYLATSEEVKRRQRCLNPGACPKAGRTPLDRLARRCVVVEGANGRAVASWYAGGSTCGARLRVDERVAVHFAGRGQQEAGLGALCEPQHVHGANEARLDRLDRVVPAIKTSSEGELGWILSVCMPTRNPSGNAGAVPIPRGVRQREPEILRPNTDPGGKGVALIVHGRSWAGQMIDLVHLQHEPLHHIVPASKHPAACFACLPKHVAQPFGEGAMLQIPITGAKIVGCRRAWNLVLRCPSMRHPCNLMQGSHCSTADWEGMCKGSCGGKHTA